jgi:predicted N-acyltransferase
VDSTASKRITVAAVDSAAAIAPEAWARLAPPGDPFVNGDFLAILERHGTAGQDCGWIARHLVARDEGGIVGILPLYLRFNSYGDFIHDWSWSQAYRQFGRQYYPKALSGMPHTPATGPRLLAAAPAVRGALIDAARALVDELGLSSWHAAFPAADDLATLEAAGLLVSHSVQFHWLDRGYGDFDGYLASFNAENRRKVRAQRRKARESGLSLEVRHGDEVDPAEWPRLHGIYAATFEKFNNWAVFTAAGFADLASTLGRRMVLFIARDQGEAVALAICFRSGEALYGRDWGSLGDYHSLHFELCFYQGIDYCLREGLVRFEPGADGEHKIARGFTPTLVSSAHWIADATLRTMIGRHLERERAAYAGYRQDAAGHLPFRRSS